MDDKFQNELVERLSKKDKGLLSTLSDFKGDLIMEFILKEPDVETDHFKHHYDLLYYLRDHFDGSRNEPVRAVIEKTERGRYVVYLQYDPGKADVELKKLKNSLSLF